MKKNNVCLDSSSGKSVKISSLQTGDVSSLHTHKMGPVINSFTPQTFESKVFFLLYDKTLVTGQKQLRDAHLIFLTSCVTMVTSVPLHLNADRAEVVVLFGLLR